MVAFFQKKFKISLLAILLITVAFIILFVVLVMNMQKPPAESIVLPETSGEVILLPGKPTDLVFLPAAAGGDPVPLDGPQLPALWNIVYKNFEFGDISQRLWMCVEADNENFSDWTIHRTITGLRSDCLRELYSALSP